MTDFGSSWLVQRLTKPIGRGSDNPFSFGGGYKNGGLSDDAMEMLRGIFAFDYMGAAEFEFGAVPEAFRRIAKSDLVAWKFDIEGHTIYALAPAEWHDQVEARIRALAKDYGEDYYRLKENTMLRPVFEGKEFAERFGGWLELDNGFMFFVDEQMWRDTCKLFGVEA